jgi:hypothetical protein
LPAADRRLLALRAYLRAGDTLESRWSWSAEEIRVYLSSAEYRNAITELEHIRARFERDNPGCTLYVNTEVRSLETQVERWNTNASVGKVAAELLRAAAEEVKAPAYASISSAEGSLRFARFLRDWRPSRAANLAAPGLSLHGRGRAFDLQVERGGVIVAGTDASTVAAVWDAQGWTRKLAAAVEATSDKFHGPLASPREPWHYEYKP